MSKTQTRGICQQCGAQYAVLKSGLMSKHGYTVEHGWFNGVCQGQNFEPVEVNRLHLDRVCDAIQTEIDKLARDLKNLVCGEAHPEFVTRSIRRQHTKINFAEAEPYEQADAVRRAIYDTKWRITQGESHIKHLKSVADRNHGNPLTVIDIETKAKPEPIKRGDVRLLDGNPIKVQYVKGAKVYYELGSMLGILSSAAWRKLPTQK